jgi:spore coat polysaccharide biosynthesis predicted glycosyltransferase SpsG
MLVVIRADASIPIGSGQVMRGLILGVGGTGAGRCNDRL